MSRFPEDERPIPEMPAYFVIEVDTIELQAGPYEIALIGLHRLHCRVGRIRVHIEGIEVRTWQDDKPVWANALLPSEQDHLVWLISDLIRAHYDTPEGQAFLRRECAKLEAINERET